MQSGAIQLLKNQFDDLSQRTPDEGIEFWFARDLMEPLDYARWENFQTAINRAIESCETTGYAVGDHFRGVTKMVKLGSGAERQIDDFRRKKGADVISDPMSTCHFSDCHGQPEIFANFQIRPTPTLVYLSQIS